MYPVIYFCPPLTVTCLDKNAQNEAYASRVVGVDGESMTWDFGGVIPRLEPKRWQVRLVDDTECIDTVMINVSHVSQFLKRHIDGSTLDSNTIITTTFADDQLEYWFPDRLVAVVDEFGADAVIPCDRPAYRGDADSFRRETVESYAADIADVVPRFRELGVNVIPLVKGETRYERRCCYEVFEDHDLRRVADYCGQYFTYGYRFSALKSRLHRIETEFQPADMMLIGLQSENLIPQLPPSVSGVAGQRWLRRIDFANQSQSSFRRTLSRWVADVNAALEYGQMPLAAFDSERGWV